MYILKQINLNKQVIAQKNSQKYSVAIFSSYDMIRQNLIRVFTNNINSIFFLEINH